MSTDETQILSEGLPDGASFGKFRVIRRLGSGMMGTVWLSHHPDLDLPVAIKTIKGNLDDRIGDFRERFLREARTAARINHPNAVRIYDAGEEDGQLYLVMEYVDGGNVSELVEKSSNGLPMQQAVQIITGIAGALEAAAEYGVVHRDIKPENIMIDRKGMPKLSDLGLAKQTGENENEMTMTGMTFGTPSYIAPEQAINSRDVDIRADIYSLGATFFQLLTGKLPYQAASAFEMIRQHIESPPPNLTTIRPDLPVRISQIIQKMMAKKAAQRYQTPSELLRDLRDLETNPLAVPPASSSKGSWILAIAAGVFLLAALAAATATGIYFLKKAPEQAIIPAGTAPNATLPDGTVDSRPKSEELRDLVRQEREKRFQERVERFQEAKSEEKGVDPLKDTSATVPVATPGRDQIDVLPPRFTAMIEYLKSHKVVVAEGGSGVVTKQLDSLNVAHKPATWHQLQTQGPLIAVNYPVLFCTASWPLPDGAISGLKVYMNGGGHVMAITDVREGEEQQAIAQFAELGMTVDVLTPKDTPTIVTEGKGPLANEAPRTIHLQGILVRYTNPSETELPIIQAAPASDAKNLATVVGSKHLQLKSGKVGLFSFAASPLLEAYGADELLLHLVMRAWHEDEGGPGSKDPLRPLGPPGMNGDSRPPRLDGERPRRLPLRR